TCVIVVSACAEENKNLPDTTTKLPAAVVDPGLTLPDGFTATTVAENLGRVRHIAVTDNGNIYAKLERLKDGKGILLLKGGDPAALSSFGNYPGTGIA